MRRKECQAGIIAVGIKPHHTTPHHTTVQRPVVLCDNNESVFSCLQPKLVNMCIFRCTLRNGAKTYLRIRQKVEHSRRVHSRRTQELNNTNSTIAWVSEPGFLCRAHYYNISIKQLPGIYGVITIQTETSTCTATPSSGRPILLICIECTEK